MENEVTRCYHAAEVKVRAERKAGEMLAKMPKASGGQPYQSTSNNLLPVELTLADLGIEKIQSSRWQQIAEMPEVEFERHIEETRGERPITTTPWLKSASFPESPHCDSNTLYSLALGV